MEGKACGNCRFFVGAARDLEREVPGLNILSSGFASVRAETAFCRWHEVFFVPSKACSDFRTISTINE